MKRNGIFLGYYGSLREGWGLLVIIGIVFTFFYILVGVVSHIGLPAQRVGIEQVRADMVQIGCTAAEDAVGIAIETNRTIKSNRYWAHNWLTGLAIPNGWDDITVIEIPDCR